MLCLCRVRSKRLACNETIWLTQKAMAALFGVQIPAIRKHLKNIFEEGEVEKKASEEYEEFNKTQKIISDFDKEIKKLQQGGGGNE